MRTTRTIMMRAAVAAALAATGAGAALAQDEAPDDAVAEEAPEAGEAPAPQDAAAEAPATKGKPAAQAPQAEEPEAGVPQGAPPVAAEAPEAPSDAAPAAAQGDAAPAEGGAVAADEARQPETQDVALAGNKPAAGEAYAASGSEGHQAFDFVSDGSRIEVKDKNFTIQPPVGWEVFTSHPNLTLLMQVPYDKSLKFQRTIQVASFTGPRYMDPVTAHEFEEKIVRNFSQISSAIEDYHVRNNTPIEMADGRKGLLFYCEYKMYGLDLMQAHILISSPTRHYLMTFTDVAEHFEKDDGRQFLTEAWDSMTSVKLAGRQPGRFDPIVMMGIGLGVLLVLAALFWAFRNWRSGKQYKEYLSGRGLDDVDMRSEAPRPISYADEPLSGDAAPLSRLDDEDEQTMARATQPRKAAPAQPPARPTAQPPAQRAAPAAPKAPQGGRPRPRAPIPPPPTAPMPTGSKQPPSSVSQLPTKSKQPESVMEDGDDFFDDEDDIAS